MFTFFLQKKLCLLFIITEKILLFSLNLRMLFLYHLSECKLTVITFSLDKQPITNLCSLHNYVDGHYIS